MSDSTSTSTPAPAEAPPATAPAPASQPALSVSEAARLLGRRRAEAAGQAAPPEADDRRPAPRDLAEASAPAESKPAAKERSAKLSPMDRALGVPGDAATASADAPAPGAAEKPGADAIEVEGERYTPAQVKEAIGKAADYTHKTQALAEQMRQVQAQQEALQMVLPYIQPELARLQQMVEGVQRPDTALLDSNPQQYFRELAAWEKAREEQSRIFSLNQYQTAAQQQDLAKRVEEANQQLAKEFPFWADPQERTQAQNEIVQWALNKGGYTKDELRNLADPRVLKTLMKAAQFDKWVQGVRSAAPAPQMRAPVRGLPPPPAPSERVSVAQENFDHRPNIRTGAALLAARRGNGSQR